MVHSTDYLYLSRHNIYYFRAIVPDGIRDELHKLEFRRSMQTRSLHVARRMGRVLRVCFDECLEEVRANMVSWEELRTILDERLVQLIAAEREKLKREGPYPLIANEIWKGAIDSYPQEIQAISAARSNRVMGGPIDISKFAQNLTGNILQAANIDLDKSTDLYMAFCEATIRMYLEFTQQRIVLNDESRSFQAQLSPPVIPPSVPVPVSHGENKKEQKGILISEAVEIYCKEMVAGGNWTPKTESEYRAAYKMLIGTVNDMPIESVDYPVAQFFKATLVKLPSNMNKKPLYKGKSIKAVAEMLIPKKELLSISKVNAYVMRISALFNWATRSGYVKLNPFSGQKIKEKVAAHEKRDPFSLMDLKALFSSPDYLLKKHKHPHYYWLPLLGLFTGARIDELCQLHLEDFYQIGDLWVFDINGKGDKKLKNQASARVIPIHSRLIDLGLVEYVFQLKKKGEVRLFPELKKQRDGYSQAASKWFSRYRKRCGVKNEQKTFHSFRHTVIDYLKQNGAAKEKIAAIAGHKDESVTMGLYGKPYEPVNLHSVIEALDFKIDVPHF